MKHSPEPQEPDRHRDGELSGSAGDHSLEGYSGSDAEIARAEDDLLAAMGRSVGGGSVGDVDGAAKDQESRESTSGPSPEFRASLREQFLAGASNDATLEQLRAWSPDPPREQFASDLRASFLQGAAASAQEGARFGVEQPTEVAPTAVRSTRGQGVTRHERAGKRRRVSGSPPSPARSSRLRLVGAGTLLAAAAAVIVFLQRPGDVVDPGLDTPAAGGNGDAVADASTDTHSELNPGTKAPVESAPAWELDTTFGDPDALLASVRIDGESVASFEEFGARMASAERVESSGFEVRLRHREEFVIELAEDTGIRLDAFRPASAAGEAAGSSLIRADFGGIRVATGPDFDPSSPLVVETPHVRTEVIGTVFGLDIGDDYTCVCCLEGEVDTTSMQLAHPALRVAAEHTSVFMEAKDRPPVRVPIVGDHREPLERLSQYWS